MEWSNFGWVPNMSRCPYCDRELPGFETLCQQCFEAGYEQVAHPKTWWQRRQFWRQWPRLTLDIFYIFVFVLLLLWGHSLFHTRLLRYHRLSVLDSPWMWLAWASIAALMESTRKDSGEDSGRKKRAPGNFRRL
jgi:hypothetical protein